MPKILCSYLFREILIPTILSGTALIFIILVRAKAPWGDGEPLVFSLLRLFFREGASRRDVTAIFLLMLPSFISFIAPMALLTGIIIGVGRMTLDTEIRAIQTSGINLFRVCFPVIVFGGLLSAGVGLLSQGAEARMLGEAVRRGAHLLVGEMSHLEPGRVYDNLFRGRGGAYFYYDEKTPAGDGMRGATLLLERRAIQGASARDREGDQRERKIKHIEALRDKGVISRGEFESLEMEIKLSKRTDPPIAIFAAEATFGVSPDDSSLNLVMTDGSVHMLDKMGRSSRRPATETTLDPAIPPPPTEAPDRDYALLRFQRLTKTESIGLDAPGRQIKLMTVPQLRGVISNPRAEGDKENRRKEERRAREARAEILKRRSMAFQSLIYALIALPLAVWIRPTGKSIGVVLAAGIILGYNLILRTGLSMVQSGSEAGPAMVFAPNIAFGAAAVVLWVRVLRK